MSLFIRRLLDYSSFLGYEGEVAKVPMRCPDVKFFTIAATDEDTKIGAETISINGVAN